MQSAQGIQTSKSLRHVSKKIWCQTQYKVQIITERDAFDQKGVLYKCKICGTLYAKLKWFAQYFSHIASKRGWFCVWIVALLYYGAAHINFCLFTPCLITFLQLQNGMNHLCAYFLSNTQTFNFRMKTFIHTCMHASAPHTHTPPRWPCG